MKQIAILYSRSCDTPYQESITRRLTNEVCDILRKQKDLTAFVEVVDGNWEGTLKRISQPAVHFVFNMCYGYKDVLQHEVVKMLDDARIKHNTSKYAEQLFAQDKLGYYSKNFKGFSNPKLFDKYEGVPVIKKLRYGAASRQMEIITSDFEIDKSNEFLYQEFIKGKEYTVAVFDVNGHKAISIGEKTFDKELSFIVTKSDAEPMLPEFLKSRLEQAALSVYNEFKMRGYIRIDFRVDKDSNIYLLDINAMPNIVQGSLCRNMIEHVTDFETFLLSNVNEFLK